MILSPVRRAALCLLPLLLAACTSISPLTTPSGTFVVSQYTTVGVYDYTASRDSSGNVLLSTKVRPLDTIQIGCRLEPATQEYGLGFFTDVEPDSVNALEVKPMSVEASTKMSGFVTVDQMLLPQLAVDTFATENISLTLDGDGVDVISLNYFDKPVHLAEYGDNATLSEIICAEFSQPSEFSSIAFTASLAPTDLNDNYGEWCGKDNTGISHNNPRPIDGLDRACMEHDLCIKAHGYHDCSCDRDFIAALRNNPSTSKPNGGAYKETAKNIFLVKPCECRKTDCIRLWNFKKCWWECTTRSWPGIGGICP